MMKTRSCVPTNPSIRRERQSSRSLRWQGISLFLVLLLSSMLHRFLLPDGSLPPTINLLSASQERSNTTTSGSTQQSLEANTNATLAGSGANVPPPLRILHEYIRQHSQSALEAEFGRGDRHRDDSYDDDPHYRPRRRYAVAYYSCPHQAGNRLHHLFNSVLWSIVLNRTVLVHYYTQEACEAAGTGHDSGICLNANQQADCDAVLRRKTWTPLYDDWKDRLGLPSISQRRWQEPRTNRSVEDIAALVNGSAILQLNYWSTRGPSATSSKRKWRSSYHAYLHIDDDAVVSAVKIVDFPQMLSQDAKVLIRGRHNLEDTLATEEARARVRDLLSLGPNYLYGMLFRNMFDFRRSIAAPLYDGENATDGGPPPIVIGLHSRHSKSTDDGSDIRGEVACIDRILDESRRHSPANRTSCRLVIMSDRSQTLHLLRERASSAAWNCSVAMAATTTQTKKETKMELSWRAEHGPYSGIGFYRDLAVMASHGRSMHAFVGGKRSSSLLIREIVEYDRYHHHHHDHHHPRLSPLGAAPPPPLTTCLLES